LTILSVTTADFINPLDLPEGTTIVDKIVEMTDGGADFTFDCTGNVQVMRSALEACHKGKLKGFLVPESRLI
jgi:Zn-dependent alcohol dehydrogenase